jgi:hypothetical protein
VAARDMFLHISFDDWARGTDDQRTILSLRVHEAFQHTRGVYFTGFDTLGTGMPALQRQLRAIGEHLARVPATTGFQGIDRRDTRRRTLGTIHRYGSERLDFDEMESLLATTDGDQATYRRSLEELRETPDLVHAIDGTTRVAAHVLAATMQMIRDNFGIPQAEFDRLARTSSFRGRCILYDAEIPNSACGVHPDGNMLSVLFTDAPGLSCFDEDWNVHEPDPNGVVVLAGSLLWRWTAGLYTPVFHYVRNVVDRSKTSVVYFYNLENGGHFRRLTTGPASEAPESYANDIQRYKMEDIDPAGPFAPVFERILTKLDYGPVRRPVLPPALDR